MDAKRVVAGGMAAGVVIGAATVMMNRIMTSRDPTGVDDSADRATPVGVFVMRSIALGIMCVLLYALIQPKLGEGVKTAVTAGLLVFLVGVLFPSFGYTMNGSFPSRYLLGSIVWSAVVIPCATIVGALLYREKERSEARGLALL